MARTIAEVSEDTIILESYIREKEPGTYLAYTLIAQDTGVHMDLRGKALLRSALKRAGRLYTTVRGAGIELSSASNASGIVETRMKRVISSVKTGAKVVEIVVDQHLKEMTEQERKNLLYAQAAFGAVNLSIKHARSLFQRPKKVMAELNAPELPM